MGVNLVHQMLDRYVPFVLACGVAQYINFDNERVGWISFVCVARTFCILNTPAGMTAKEKMSLVIELPIISTVLQGLDR